MPSSHNTNKIIAIVKSILRPLKKTRTFAGAATRNDLSRMCRLTVNFFPSAHGHEDSMLQNLLLNLCQSCHSGSVDHLAQCIEARAVTGAVPGEFRRVPVHDAA